MDQLNLCIHTCSPNIIFNSAPLTFKTFCPELVVEDANLNKRSFDKVNGLDSNNKLQKSNNIIGNHNNSNTFGNNNEKNGKNNIGNSNNTNNNTKRPDFTGSIINRTGNKIHFPVQTLPIQRKLVIVELHVFLIMLYSLLDIMKMILHLW